MRAPFFDSGLNQGFNFGFEGWFLNLARHFSVRLKLRLGFSFRFGLALCIRLRLKHCFEFGFELRFWFGLDLLENRFTIGGIARIALKPSEEVSSTRASTAACGSS